MVAPKIIKILKNIQLILEPNYRRNIDLYFNVDIRIL